jgi:hypothetical protein
MSRIEFGDSLTDNLAILDELIRSLPPSERAPAAQAANRVEAVFKAIRRDHGNSPGAALGTAWAFFKLAQNIVESKNAGEVASSSMIQLLS